MERIKIEGLHQRLKPKVDSNLKNGYLQFKASYNNNDDDDDDDDNNDNIMIKIIKTLIIVDVINFK